MSDFEENISSTNELRDFVNRVKQQELFSSKNLEAIRNQLETILEFQTGTEYFEQVVEAYSNGNAGSEELKDALHQNASHIYNSIEAALTLEELQNTLTDSLATNVGNKTIQDRLKAVTSINNYVIDELLLDLMSELHQYEVVKEECGSTPLTMVAEQKKQKTEEFIDVLAERNPEEAKYIYNMILEEEK